MGFFEIFMVLIVAIIFLGPDKLPQALVDLVKFFKTIKKTLDDAKTSLDKELNLEELKKEALEYKNSFTQSLEELNQDIKISDEIKSLEESIKIESKNDSQMQQTPKNEPATLTHSQNATPQESIIPQQIEEKNQPEKESQMEQENQTEQESQMEKENQAEENPLNPQASREAPPYFMQTNTPPQESSYKSKDS